MLPDNLLRERRNQKDVVHYISKFGKGLKNLFDSPPKARKTFEAGKAEKPEKSEEPEESKEPATGMTFGKLLQMVNHSFSFGEVYANDLAKAEIKKESPMFPVGSIIVREKNLTTTSETPEIVIAMVKREKGFSEKTDDWEFFVFDGKDLKIQKRETTGNCAQCHSQAKKTDWVFQDYLK